MSGELSFDRLGEFQAVCGYCDSSIELDPGVSNEVWCEAGHFFTLLAEHEDSVRLRPLGDRHAGVPVESGVPQDGYVIASDEDTVCPWCDSDLMIGSEDTDALLRGADGVVVRCGQGHEWETYIRDEGEITLFRYEFNGPFTTI